MPSSVHRGLLRDDTTGALIVQGITDYGDGRTGQFGTPFGTIPNNANAVTDKRQSMIRFRVDRPRTIVSGAFATTVASSLDDSCQIAILNSTLGTILASSLVTAGKLNSAIGRKILALQASVALVPGVDYYSTFIGGVAGTAASLCSIDYRGLGSTLAETTEGATPGPPTTDVLFKTNGSVAIAAPVATPSATSNAPAIYWREY